MLKRFVAPAILLLLAVNIAIQTSRTSYFQDWVKVESPREAANLKEVLRLVNPHQAGSTHSDIERVSTDTLRHMVDNLDNYSTYMEKDEFSDFRKQTSQRYVGIGVQVHEGNGDIIINRVFRNGPAYKSGLQSQDQIVKVNDFTVAGKPLNKALERLRGPSGSPVDLVVYRPGEERHIPVSLERGAVIVPTVENIYYRSDGIGYLHITHFGHETRYEFSQAILHLKHEGMQGLIIDLRDNPGGVMGAAVEIADFLLPKESLILSTQARGDVNMEEMRARQGNLLEGYPVAVLINNMSASASEILSGALQAHGRAILVGERTVGKGSVQSIFSLSNGDGVKMTTANYFLPDGKSINHTGVLPDIPVQLNDSERARLYTQRMNHLAVKEGTFSRRFGFEPIVDRQLEAAISALHTYAGE